jgi:hypothetical protein
VAARQGPGSQADNTWRISAWPGAWRAGKQTRVPRADARHRLSAGHLWAGFHGESHGPQPNRGKPAVRDDIGGRRKRTEAWNEAPALAR